MRSPKIITIAALLLAVFTAACFFDVYTFTQYSCLDCRATLTKRRIYGFPFKHISYDTYSKSFIAHDHQWRWCGSIEGYSLISVTRACGRRHPIWGLPVAIHAKYSQLVPPAELHDALLIIDSNDPLAADKAIDRIYERVLDPR